jgi:methylase of polypeptide subunit release factors
LTCPESKYDFRNFPYGDAEFDTVVFDPPYVHNPGRLIVDANYRNAETTRGMYHDDILKLYVDGMKEACRVLKTGGYLWVKCKDEVEASVQRWSHIELFLVAAKLGFYAKDCFILTQVQKPLIQFKKQQHARKNHSYLWVFEKASPTDKRVVMQKRGFEG